MANNIDSGSLTEVINKELTIYSKGVTENVKKIAKESMAKLVKQTKATAPVGKRTKHYRDSISSKKTEDSDRGVTYTWYVKGSNYRLSHLLERGHALRGGGRVEGTHFIEKASDPILAEYEQKVEEAIQNVK